MANYLLRIKNYIKLEPIAVVFFLAVLGSFIYQTNFRTQHFQECDSAGTYHLIYGFPQEALLYSAYTYPEGHLLSQAQAEKLLNFKPVDYFVKKYLPGFTQDRLVNKLTRLNVALAARFVFIEAAASLHLPHFLNSAVALPFSATFSPGYGFLYGLVTGPHFSYEQFMFMATLLTSLFFHLAVLLVYFTCRRLKAGAFASAFTACLMLFAITMYSSNYDVGSRPWNLISSVVWVWYLAKVADSPKVLKKVSWSSAILVYFNYLIAFFWLGFVLAMAFKNNHTSIKNYIKEAWAVLKTQKAAIIFTLLCGIIFFQPGQGFRGNLTWHTWASDVYYVVLNFFSFYVHSGALNILQFILGLGLIILSLWAYLRYSKTQNNAIKVFSLAMLMFVGLYTLASIMQVVGFAPNRQVMFLIAAVYPGIALGIDYIIGKFNLVGKQTILMPVFVLLLVLGFSGIYARRADAIDRTANITFDSDVKSVEVGDCSYNIVEKNWHSPIAVEFLNPEALMPGQTYLYLSQTTPFEKELALYKDTYNFNVQVLNNYEDINLTYFVAYNPDPLRFPFSRPNSLYETKFKVLSVAKK